MWSFDDIENLRGLSLWATEIESCVHFTSLSPSYANVFNIEVVSLNECTDYIMEYYEFSISCKLRNSSRMKDED